MNLFSQLHSCIKGMGIHKHVKTVIQDSNWQTIIKHLPQIQWEWLGVSQHSLQTGRGMCEKRGDALKETGDLILFLSDSREASSWMALRNHTSNPEFVLTGLSDDPHVQPLLFVLFLGIYLLTLMGNLTLLLLIRADSLLHTPMYFFLSNPSFLDLCSASPLSLCQSCWRTCCQRRKPSQWRAAWPRSSLCFSLQEMKPACSQWWPMTAMPPSATLCSTARWWATSSVWGWCGAPGAWPLSMHLSLCSWVLTSISVMPTPSTTAPVSCPPSSLCLALMYLWMSASCPSLLNYLGLETSSQSSYPMPV